MIAGYSRLKGGRSAAKPAEPLGKGKGVFEVLEMDLDRDSPPFRTDLDLVTDRRLELVGGIPKCRLHLRSELSSRTSLFHWLASQLGTILGLADRPPGPHCIAS